MNDSIWTSEPPSSHFHGVVPRQDNQRKPAEQQPTERQPAKRPKTEPEVKGRNKKPRAKPPPDFFSTSALLEAIVPLAANSRSIVKDLTERAGIVAGDTQRLRFPQLMGPNGTSCFICFKSAFVAPHNKCATAGCNREGGPFRLHVDLSKAEWSSKPEDYWATLVAWLREPQIAAVIRPTQALKSLTPGANW